MSAIITQASDPGAVVDDFAVDVQDKFAQRVIGPVAFGEAVESWPQLCGPVPDELIGRLRG